MRPILLRGVGAFLAVVTGTVALALVSFLAGFFSLLELFWGASPGPENEPLIGVGEGGIIYSLVVIVLGIVAGWSAKWGGFGLMACALAGFMFGPKDSIIPLLVLIAAVLCLAGAWQERGRIDKQR
jgi:hypothetical protein